MPKPSVKNFRVHAFYFIGGFSLSPFIAFVANTTILLVTNPAGIKEGMAIIYVFLLGGTILFLKEYQKFLSRNLSFSDIVFILLGFVIYSLVFLYHIFLLT